MHCDPCENVFDTPLMYEIGWGKKLSYVMAYSRDEVQDVTWRYSCRHNELLSRRNECTEKELLDAIIQLRQERQQDMSTSRKLYLSKRLLAELVEFMTPRQPTEGERKVSILVISCIDVCFQRHSLQWDQVVKILTINNITLVHIIQS